MLDLEKEQMGPDGVIPNYSRPIKDLGSGFGLDRIVLEMNIANCFDFDYRPREKHVLCLYGGAKGRRNGYFVLTYQKGEWQPMEYGISPNAQLRNIAGGSAQWEY